MSGVGVEPNASLWSLQPGVNTRINLLGNVGDRSDATYPFVRAPRTRRQTPQPRQSRGSCRKIPNAVRAAICATGFRGLFGLQTVDAKFTVGH